MQALDAQPKIDLLIECGPLKVWSVIVTILGDLCQSRTDRIDGQVLQQLTGRMGISAQAVRVALHRLRRDDWIESVKKGRRSEYFLSASGWKQTQAVRARIYAEPQPDPGHPALVLAPPGITASDLTEALPSGAVLLAPRTALVCEADWSCPPDYWTTPLSSGQVPDWVLNLLADNDLRSEYAALTSAASQVGTSPAPTDLLDCSTLRLLTLHHWRRLRLRHGDLPGLLLGPDWEGAQAQDAVMTVLATHPRPRLDDLAEALSG